METSDKRLWIGWTRRGDEHDFEALVRPHMAFALDFARRMGCTSDEADDVVQTCLARLAVERGDKPVRVGIRAWLGRSVSLEARMLKRAEGRRTRREQAWEPFIPEESSIDERMAQVQRGIDQLTPAQREVVWLRYRHDLDYKEIAKILGVSENACRLRVHKSMGLLRERLGRDAGPLVATLPLMSGRIGMDVIPLALEKASHLAPAATSSSLAVVLSVVVVGLGALGIWLMNSQEESAPKQGVEQTAVRGAARVAEEGAHGPGPALGTGDNAPPDKGDTNGEASGGRPGKPSVPALAPPASVRSPESPLLPQVVDKPKRYRRLVEAARAYFNLDVDKWESRQRLLEALTKEAEAGRYWLKDLPALRWLCAQGRSFEPPLTDRKWRASQGITHYRSTGGTLHTLQTAVLPLAFARPRSHPRPRDLREDFPRGEPHPLLLSMLEPYRDSDARFPGSSMFLRRYPQKSWKEFYKDWLALCPIAPGGNYLGEESLIRSDCLQGPLSTFWRHYHVDFDRVVLDGATQAFDVATSQGVFFAGIIFRPDAGRMWGLRTEEMRRDVKNFAHIPVYVVDNADLAQELRDAGHGSVTAGAGDASLLRWMNGRRRTTPLSFQWTAGRVDQVLPYWINLDSVDWRSLLEARSLQVEVVDTAEEPNTIRIEAGTGIEQLSIFLNDEIVDLDRKVRVVINGHIEHDARASPESEQMAEIGRDLDVLFDRDPVRIRPSMFFGFLYSAQVVGLKVRPPAAK